jgi:hypothetical protein
MNFLDLMGIEYRKSRRALYLALFCGGAVYAVVLVDTLLRHSHSEPLALAAFIFQAAGILLKHRSSSHYASAEEIRRIAVLKDGLGIEPSELEKADIVSRCGASPPPGRMHFGKYFASEKPAGTARLLEDIEESAFWTNHIASATSKAAFALVVVGSAISVFAIIGLITAGASSDTLKITAEAVVVTLGFVVTGEFLVLSLDYRALSERAARKVTSSSAQLSSGATNREAAILLFGEYNCALAGSAPLPTFMYSVLHRKLNTAWAARRAQFSVE